MTSPNATDTRTDALLEALATRPGLTTAQLVCAVAGSDAILAGECVGSIHGLVSAGMVVFDTTAAAVRWFVADALMVQA